MRGSSWRVQDASNTEEQRLIDEPGDHRVLVKSTCIVFSPGVSKIWLCALIRVLQVDV